MKKTQRIKAFFDTKIPICLLGFDFFYEKIKKSLSDKHSEQLKALHETGFSSDIGVYLSKYAFLNYYYANPFACLPKAIKDLSTSSVAWEADLSSTNFAELKTAHSAYIDIKPCATKKDEFVVSGQLCEQMLTDELTVDRLINDLIIQLLLAKKISPQEYFRTIHFSSSNEHTLPHTIMDKLIYSRRISFSSREYRDYHMPEKTIKEALLFFSTLKNYKITVKFDFSGSVKSFSTGLMFTQRLNDMLQAISACATTVLKANEKFPELFSKKFNFYFQDNNCNSLVTRKITVDQYVQIEDAYLYNCTIHEAKIGAQLGADYLVIADPNHSGYFLSDLIVKAIYHKFSSMDMDGIFLMYQVPLNKFFDTLEYGKFLEESVQFYDRIGSHLVP